MPAKGELSDDYVASLLAEDAKTSNVKYSTYGLQELLPRRATTNAPKPNTRFLKNIIRETDSHNAALRAKEQEESRARLRKLRDGNGTSPTSSNGHGRLTPEDDHRSKRRRVERENEGESDRRRDHGGRTRSCRKRDKDSRRHHRYRDERYHTDEDEGGRSRHHHRRHRHHRSHRQRSTSRSKKHRRRTRDEEDIQSRNRSRSRSPSPRRERRPHPPLRKPDSPAFQDNGTRNSAKTRKDEKTAFQEIEKDVSTNGQNYAASSASDSDPLEAIIGPPPPAPAPKVRSRGRGTFASSSAMDSHFSSNYDPSTDVQLDLDEVDDWDMALEALRDRQLWQKQGAERLKSAGFTEEEVQKWEKGGEKKEEDVRWKGKGEGREWDRGKIVGEEGIETVPEWGRLKGT